MLRLPVALLRERLRGLDVALERGLLLARREEAAQHMEETALPLVEAIDAATVADRFAREIPGGAVRTAVVAAVGLDSVGGVIAVLLHFEYSLGLGRGR